MGKHMMVVGATGGIGAALARRLVARGDRVALVARGAERLEALGTELGGAVVALPADAGDSTSMEAAVREAEAAFGPVDGLAHAVGSILIRPMHLTRLEDLDAAFHANVRTLWNAMRAVLPGMQARRSGAVVAFGSVAGQVGLANHEAIAAAKGAVSALVRSAAITYASSGIRINAIAPALVDTPLAAGLLRSDAARAASMAMHPLGRVGQADEVAALAAHLLSEEAAWMTGQVIGIDGGLGAGVPKPGRPS
ncbi:MAG: SDR family oxidoreductase [Candidatus Sericytochromatia bacterium]|nr:SDR family oxidoreductase [Candidatus Tanganyikabacteria bacterium]